MYLFWQAKHVEVQKKEEKNKIRIWWHIREKEVKSRDFFKANYRGYLYQD